MKQGPQSPGMNNGIHSMMNSSTLISIMPMLMPACSGIITRNGLPQAGEGSAIRKGVHANPEPRHAVTAGDTHQAECQIIATLNPAIDCRTPK
jgi:hypothetical protein